MIVMCDVCELFLFYLCTVLLDTTFNMHRLKTWTRSEKIVFFVVAHLNMSDKLNTYHIDIKQPYKPYFSPPIIFLWHKTTDDSTDQKIEIFKFEWHDIRYTATVSSTIGQASKQIQIQFVL